MEIYEALKKDHEAVKALLSELVTVSDSEKSNRRRHQLIEQISKELIPHSRAEEAVFYNSLRLLDVSKKLALHGYQEHFEAEALLRTLQVLDLADASWMKTATKLKEVLEHHIAEEEGEVFPAAQQLFTSEEAVVMAEAFEKMKSEVKEDGIAMNTLSMIKNMMPPRLSMALDDMSASIMKSIKTRNAEHKHH